MLISRTLLVPHLPTLVVDQHRGHRTEMLEALERASERFLAESPEIVVVLSARSEAPGPFLVGTARRHSTITDYTGFGVEVRYDCAGHPTLARALVDAGQKANAPVGPMTRGIDSGVSVPLHFLVPSRALPVVPLGIAPRTIDECRQWGAVLRRVLSARPEPIGFVVGGLLAKNEHAWNLGRDVPEGRDLDAQVIADLERGDWSALEGIAAERIAKASPEAGLRHLHVLRGFLAEDALGTLQCYESSPGMGAALIEFPVTQDATASAAPPAPPPR